MKSADLPCTMAVVNPPTPGAPELAGWPGNDASPSPPVLRYDPLEPSLTRTSICSLCELSGSMWKLVASYHPVGRPSSVTRITPELFLMKSSASRTRGSVPASPRSRQSIPPAVLPNASTLSMARMNGSPPGVTRPWAVRFWPLVLLPNPPEATAPGSSCPPGGGGPTSISTSNGAADAAGIKLAPNRAIRSNETGCPKRFDMRSPPGSRTPPLAETLHLS